VVALFLRFGVSAVTESFTAMGWAGFAAILLWRLGLIGLMGASWWVLGRGRADARAGRFIWGRLMRDSGSEVLPLSQVGGFVSGARALTVSGVAGTFATASTLVDLSIELVTKLPYTAAGLALLYALRPHTPLVVPVLAGLLVLSALAVLSLGLASHGARFGDRIWAKLAQRWRDNEIKDTETIRHAVGEIQRDRPALGLAAAGHLCSWFIGGVETWITLQFMGMPLDIGAAIAIDSLVATLRSVAFFVPNAVGVQEGGYLMLCAAFGIPPAGALALSLLKRARDWVIGVPALLAWQLKESQRARLGACKKTAPPG